MSYLTQVVGSSSTLTVTGLSTLASATYVVSDSIDNTSTNAAMDLLIEVAITPGTVSGNKQCLVFAQASYDNSIWQTGPTSGTTTTDEPVLTFVGRVPLATNSTLQRAWFSIANCYGGSLPPYLRLVFKNDSGAAFSAATVKLARTKIQIS